MRHFYFIEDESGEEFIVGAKTLAEAWVIANDIAAQIGKEYDICPTSMSYEYEMTEEEAEASGLDEY